MLPESFPSASGVLLGASGVLSEYLECFWSDLVVLLEVFSSGPRPCLSLRLRPSLSHLADGTPSDQGRALNARPGFLVYYISKSGRAGQKSRLVDS